MRRAAVLLIALSLAACTSKLPPHVWIKIPRSEADMFWWTETRQCSLRVFYWDRDTPKTMGVEIDASVCLEWLKADGYDVKGLKP